MFTYYGTFLPVHSTVRPALWSRYMGVDTLYGGGEVLRGLRHWVEQYIVGKKPRQSSDGIWHYPPL